MTKPLLLILLIFIEASCYTPRYVYSPSAHNVPVFEKKGDSKIAFNYSSNIGSRNSEGSRVHINHSSGMDLQAAVALNKHWSAQLSYYNRKEKNDGDYSSSNLDRIVVRYNRNLAEAGVGYTRVMGKNGKLGYQIYGGIGFGKFRMFDNGKDASAQTFNRYFNTRVNKYYLQPAIIMRPSPTMAIIFSSRVSLLKFHSMHTDYNETELNNFKLDSIGYKPVLFWEPAFVHHFNLKKIPGLGFEYQLGLALLSSRNFVDARPFNFSAGLVLDLPKLLARKVKLAKTNKS